MARGRGGRGGSAVDHGLLLETTMDAMSVSSIPPTLLNGVYTLQGNQMAVMNNLNNFGEFMNNHMKKKNPGMNSMPQMTPLNMMPMNNMGPMFPMNPAQVNPMGMGMEI